MSAETSILRTLAVHFALLSLLSVGGANAVIPEIHRQVVEVSGWLTDRQFADLFALAQVTPGPNVVIVTLIGFQVAGISGALVATLAMCGPSCLFAFLFAKIWDRFRHSPWRAVVQAALVPVSLGLLSAGALVIVRTLESSWAGATIAASTAMVAYWTRFNPLWIFAAAGIMGALGLV